MQMKGMRSQIVGTQIVQSKTRKKKTSIGYGWKTTRIKERRKKIYCFFLFTEKHVDIEAHTGKH